MDYTIRIFGNYVEVYDSLTNTNNAFNSLSDALAFIDKTEADS